jgi:hypothetical protein
MNAALILDVIFALHLLIVDLQTQKGGELAPQPAYTL